MEVLGQPGTMDYFKLAEGGSWHLTLTSGYFLIIRDKEYYLSSFNTRRRLSKGQVCRKGFESCVTINACFNFIHHVFVYSCAHFILYLGIGAILGSSDRKFFFLAPGICLLILPSVWSAACANADGRCGWCSRWMSSRYRNVVPAVRFNLKFSTVVKPSTSDHRNELGGTINWRSPEAMYLPIRVLRSVPPSHAQL